MGTANILVGHDIGSTEEITILDLARRVKELTASSSEIVLVPYDEAYEDGFEDIPRRVPDLSKIGALVGYRPTTSLDDIIRAVIDARALVRSLGLRCRQSPRLQSPSATTE